MDKEELLVIEPIIGYRFWDIYCVKEKGKYTIRLKGAGVGGQNGFWVKGINIAKCIDTTPSHLLEIDRKPIKYKKHKAPKFKCSCGFYTNKYRIDFIYQLLNSNDLNYFCGLVELTGKVIEHSSGYRAEKAEIKKLIWCKDEDKISLSYEDKDKKEVKETEKEEEKDNQIRAKMHNGFNPNSVNNISSAPILGVAQNLLAQSIQQAPQTVFQRAIQQAQQISATSFNLNSSCSYWAKIPPVEIFTKNQILKQISEYYQVPIIYYKDYLEKELLK